VIALGSALKSAAISSVVAAPDAVAVTVVAQAPEEIAVVPRDTVPLATVITVPKAFHA
jgi:hypothetical protein